MIHIFIDIDGVIRDWTSPVDTAYRETGHTPNITEYALVKRYPEWRNTERLVYEHGLKTYFYLMPDSYPGAIEALRVFDEPEEGITYSLLSHQTEESARQTDRWLKMHMDSNPLAEYVPLGESKAEVMGKSKAKAKGWVPWVDTTCLIDDLPKNFEEAFTIPRCHPVIIRRDWNKEYIKLNEHINFSFHAKGGLIVDSAKEILSYLKHLDSCHDDSLREHK